MLVNLPEGWEKSPENPYGELFAKGEWELPYRFGTGQYLDLHRVAIEHLIANAHPLDPAFTKGSDVERMQAIRRHYDEGRPEDYGVCDYPTQVVERWPELEADRRPFVILFQRVRRADQPRQGGWRWHKWGRCIGNHEPQCEYLYDEREIDSVFIFKILQIRGGS